MQAGTVGTGGHVWPKRSMSAATTSKTTKTEWQEAGTQDPCSVVQLPITASGLRSSHLEHCPFSFPLNLEDRPCPTGSGHSTEHPSPHPDPKDPENCSWELNPVYVGLTAHSGRPQ